MDHAAGSNPEQSKQLAETMLGRETQRRAAVPLQNKPIDGVGKDEKDRAYNQFTFDNDPDGVRCPFGAHMCVAQILATQTFQPP